MSTTISAESVFLPLTVESLKQGIRSLPLELKWIILGFLPGPTLTILQYSDWEKGDSAIHDRLRELQPLSHLSIGPTNAGEVLGYLEFARRKDVSIDVLDLQGALKDQTLHRMFTHPHEKGRHPSSDYRAHPSLRSVKELWLSRDFFMAYEKPISESSNHNSFPALSTISMFCRQMCYNKARGGLSVHVQCAIGDERTRETLAFWLNNSFDNRRQSLHCNSYWDGSSPVPVFNFSGISASGLHLPPGEIDSAKLESHLTETFDDYHPTTLTILRPSSSSRSLRPTAPLPLSADDTLRQGIKQISLPRTGFNFEWLTPVYQQDHSSKHGWRIRQDWSRAGSPDPIPNSDGLQENNSELDQVS